MNQSQDFLVEILTEELPPKSLLKLAEIFTQQIQERLRKLDLSFDDAISYATPRRLAVMIKNLQSATPDQVVDRKGPALSAAYDANGKASPACEGFAKSCGVTVADLQTTKSAQGEWVSYQQAVPGKPVTTLLPDVVQQALQALPIPKRMRWGDSETQFVRPVHGVIMLYGDKIIDATILGCQSGRKTQGHRFHSPEWITINHPADYEDTLLKHYVMANITKRREKIRDAALAAHAVVNNKELLDEVTGLVEWPVILQGNFDEAFLDLPGEVLISSMQDHQRYFPVLINQQLASQFVTVSNIDSKDQARVIHGNERVLRARLSDAAFFFAADKQESLEQRLERLKGIVFQAKLGTLYDKAQRISRLAAFIAKKIDADDEQAARAGLLCKTDLTTNMVNEFPELQGVMGGHYALHDDESTEIADAIWEHYLPSFSGDATPKNSIGQVVSIADRIDTLVGTFGINQIPTGDKDPFGLRRAALGVLRIIIENNINLDLNEVITFAKASYGDQLANKEVVPQVLTFLQERLRAWYQDHGITPDVFAAVAALNITNPLDAHRRIQAVQAFKQLNEAEALSAANKRVSNILDKYKESIEAKTIRQEFFENTAEEKLAKQLELKSQSVARLYEVGDYDQVLLQLADLRQPIDDFFENVMVMVDDKPKRENRLLLLAKLRALFLQVADIALLQ